VYEERGKLEGDSREKGEVEDRAGEGVVNVGVGSRTLDL